MSDLQEMCDYISDNIDTVPQEKRCELEELYNVGIPLAKLVSAEILLVNSASITDNIVYIRSAYYAIQQELVTNYEVTLKGSDGTFITYTVEAASPCEAFRKLGNSTTGETNV